MGANHCTHRAAIRAGGSEYTKFSLRQESLMKKISLAIALILVVTAFFAGRYFGRKSDPASATSEGRKILYWHDPMHPAYKSDKPGIAPDCGMQLEPVYADGLGSAESAEAGSLMPPGTIQVSPEKQQLIGLKAAQVKMVAGQHTIRVLGRVVPDENRIYRINASTDGWVREIFPITTGSLVKKDDLLANIYAPETFSAMKAYLFGLRSLDRFNAAKEAKEQIEITNDNLENYRNALRNVGMTDHQLDEIMRTRKGGDFVEIRATDAGFILARNISMGQRFERGAELYQIADLSHIWVLADLFGQEARQMHPGMEVRASLSDQGLEFKGKVSAILPQFDPVTRALKVRLEVNNPRYELRPDMFVDVDFPIQTEPALTVPSEAVLDSGLKKIVFVDRGKGFFEPRQVETGLRMGGQVEITKGLMEGERIVVSGNFLVDSESQLKLSAAGLPEDYEVDPVCGMGVDPRKAGSKKTDYNGRTFYFCSDLCKSKFENDPGKYLRPAAKNRMKDMENRISEKSVKDLVCGMEVNPATPGALKTVYKGKTYYFCSDHCKSQFEKNPGKFLKQESTKPALQSNSAKSMLSERL
jgi:membrane fusion protein, copper/silver efflux system